MTAEIFRKNVDGVNVFTKKIFLLVAGLIVVCAVILAITGGGGGQTALKIYCKAIEKGDGEKMLSIYQDKYIEQLASDEEVSKQEIMERVSEMTEEKNESLTESCEGKFRYTYNITAISEYDASSLAKLNDYLGLFGDDGVTSAYMIQLQFVAKGKEDDYGRIEIIHVYQSEKQWYIMMD